MAAFSAIILNIHVSPVENAVIICEATIKKILFSFDTSIWSMLKTTVYIHIDIQSTLKFYQFTKRILKMSCNRSFSMVKTSLIYYDKVYRNGKNTSTFLIRTFLGWYFITSHARFFLLVPTAYSKIYIS